MAIKKKYAKGRLDKYYHMAKEQGYRARSAFKLIQLNKKYNFLEKAKVCIDLCAAPGGWLQVASKYMPKPSLIIGIDLAAIPPIPGVMTFVEDITTPKCRSIIKKELKTWKADVFLHDGAPNVGTSWIQDAFFQSELTLSALKLATEFLMPGGTFVSKVFRSKDYNKLMWVFNQLFGRVEATKPTSSRNVSAEIFVVCRDYLAPKKIDSRILDPTFVFKEVDDVVDDETDEKKLKERQGVILNNIFHPEKRRRHRDGYEDGDYTQHTSTPVSEFVRESDFLDILARTNSLVFTPECSDIANHALTNDEIKELCVDLKVIGKKDFKTLIKWRDSLRIDLGLSKSRKAIETERKTAAEEEQKKLEQDENDATLAEKVAKEAELIQNAAKKAKKKQRERKAKVLLKMRLGMDTPQDIGLDAAQMDPLDVGEFEMGSGLHRGGDKDDVSGASDDSDLDSEGSQVGDSDDEMIGKMADWEQEMDGMFTDYLSRKSKKDLSAVVKKQKEGVAAEFEEWYGAEFEKSLEGKTSGTAEDGESSDFSSDSDEEDKDEIPSKAKLSETSKVFFDNPVFKALQAPDSGNGTSMFSRDMEDMNSSDDDQVIRNAKNARKRKRKGDGEEESKDIEIVPIEEHDPEGDDENYAIETAQEYALAQQLVRPSGKRDAIDKAYNRYAFNDPDLPDWFAADENRHNKPSMPVTKQAMEVIKQRAMAIDARPIKKVAEAKFRKKARAERRVQKMIKKAEVLNDDEDNSEKSKLTKIAAMMKKAKSSPGKAKEKPKLVVAKGMNRGQKGRPKGVSGRYKMVDPRMKLELRAEKRIKKSTQKRRR